VARHAAARSTSGRWRRAARNRSRPPRWRTECTIAPWLCGPAAAIIAYLRSSSADTWAGSRHARVDHRHAARPDDPTAHPFRPRGHPRVSRSRRSSSQRRAAAAAELLAGLVSEPTGGASDVPHWAQKRRPSRFSVPQLGQSISRMPSALPPPAPARTACPSRGTSSWRW
jgi:hypothetical protein